MENLLPHPLSSMCLETSGTAAVRAGASEPQHRHPGCHSARDPQLTTLEATYCQAGIQTPCQCRKGTTVPLDTALPAF